MDVPKLERALNELTATLGDPTRRSIYLRVRGSTDPLTATLVAKEFGIHPNVARHHLDRLTEEGYLEVTRRRPPGRTGPGAGRPAKCYVATGKEIDLQFPTRRLDLLIDLLTRIVLRLAPEDGHQIVIDMGREFGRELASSLSPANSSLEAVAALMQGEGFEIIVDPSGAKLLTQHCPFKAATFEQPELLCSLDRGIMTGVFEVLDPKRAAALEANLGAEHACVTTV